MAKRGAGGTRQGGISIIFLADGRNMAEVEDASVHLVVSSPPYWHPKDYSTGAQIGYGQSLHEYLYDLSRVWRECYRVLKAGRRLCINIGDSSHEAWCMDATRSSRSMPKSFLSARSSALTTWARLSGKRRRP
ncbi:MAG: DNA methyltransferase [Armatimonadota bacterium]